MLLKNLKFERFPVYIHWENGGLNGHSILVEQIKEKIMSGHTIDEDNRQISMGGTFSDKASSSDCKIIHWEYLDNSAISSEPTMCARTIPNNSCICIGAPSRYCPICKDK